jgi:hypothetical protein
VTGYGEAFLIARPSSTKISAGGVLSTTATPACNAVADRDGGKARNASKPHEIATAFRNLIVFLSSGHGGSSV